MKLMKELTKGIFLENPIFVIMLGLCSTLAVSTNAANSLGMGVAFAFVIIGSNVGVSLLRKVTPNQIRIPVYIIVISTFVTIVDYVMKAYTPVLSRSMGVFIPLIVVNCIVMGRAEAFASKNGVMASLMDAIGMGIGYTVAIVAVGAIREVLGNGTIFGAVVLPPPYQPILIMVLPPGAFLVIGLLQALQNRLLRRA